MAPHPIRPPLISRIARALELAQQVHAGQLNRAGEPMIVHVQRVAASVPAATRPLALVHDICERSPLSPSTVALKVDLDWDEQAALSLLTKHAGESLLDHTSRVITSSNLDARRLALEVKRADIDDHGRGPGGKDQQYVEATALLDAAD